MARKKASKKKSTTKAQLPKNFTPIGGFGKSWPNDDTKPGDMIVGTVTEYDEVTVIRNNKKKQVQNLKLETEDGEVFTLWESAGLKALFGDEDFTDCELAIIYEGLGKKKRGQNPPKLFQLGYAE